MPSLIATIKKCGLKCTWYKIKNTYFFPDKAVQSISARNGSYEYVKRYAYAATASADRMTKGEKTIWVCWFQGFEQAPLLVKRCLASIHKYASAYRVVELTDVNLRDYVQLPDYIWEKYAKGVISKTHMSDMVRFALLSEKGGIWIDSTTLLTGFLPTYITDAPLFVYHSDQFGSSLLSVNFISSCAHHPLVEDTFLLLLEYWRHENRTVDYNTTALMWTIATRKNEINSKLWREVLFVPTGLKEILFNTLSKPFSKEKWEQIQSLSPVHKLTYKFQEFGIDTNAPGTFYHQLFVLDNVTP